MRTAIDCTRHAEECRRLAKLAVKPGDFGHLLEMAETWELLAKQRKADEQVAAQQVVDEQVADQQVADQQVADQQVADILALADAIANSRAPLRPF